MRSILKSAEFSDLHTRKMCDKIEKLVKLSDGPLAFELEKMFKNI